MAAGEERRKQALLQGPIRRVQRRLNRELWAKGLVAPAWCAVTVLALYRFAFREHLALAAFAVAATSLVFWVGRTRPRLVPLARAAAITDQRVGAGGLLLTRLELPVGEWELSLNEQVRGVTPPSISIRRPVGLLLLAAAFLVASLLVPLPPRPTSRVNAAAASRLAEVEARAEALARERSLADEQAELARLREELAQGRFDATDWEAADGLSGALEQKAAQAAAELSKAEAAARALEEALAKGQANEEVAREREALEKALLSVNGESSSNQGTQGTDKGSGANGAQGEKDDSAKAGKEGAGKEGAGKEGPGPGNSASDVAELRRALGARQQALARAFGQGNSSPGSPRAPKEEARGSGKGKGRGDEKEEGSGEGEGQEGGEAQAHASRGVKKGAGTGRGGEGRPLVFGGEAEVRPDRLQFTPLPKGNGGEAGELWGLRVDPRPDMEHARGQAMGSVAEGERVAGTRSGPLLPRNRELVRRYFDSGVK